MKEIPTHEELIADIDAHLEKTEMKAHVFGRGYLNDAGAISRLRGGSDPRLSTVQKIYNILRGDL